MIIGISWLLTDQKPDLLQEDIEALIALRLALPDRFDLLIMSGAQLS